MSTFAQKQDIVGNVTGVLADTSIVLYAENKGLSVAQMTSLRRQLRQSGGRIQVVKNRLMKRAIAESDYAVISGELAGPLIYGFGADPVAVAKSFHDFASASEGKLVLKGGSIGSRMMSRADIVSLSTLPSREALLAKLLATLQAPPSHFVRLLSEMPTRLVRLLAAVRDSKGDSKE